MNKHLGKHRAVSVIIWLIGLVVIASIIGIIGVSRLQEFISQATAVLRPPINSLISALTENPGVAQAVFVGAQVLTLFVLVFLTYLNVKNGRNMIEANEDMVESNQNVVEETRKDRKREPVKKLLTNLEPLREELDKHRYQINNLTDNTHSRRSVSGRSYSEIDEWDLDLSSFPKYDLRRIERQIDETEMIQALEDYERKYKQYRTTREIEEGSIQNQLLQSRIIPKKIRETDWSDAGPYSHMSSIKSSRVDPLTDEEVAEYIENNQEEVAANLIEGGPVTDHYYPIYTEVLEAFKEEDALAKKSFGKLDDAASDLKSAYERLENEIGRFERATLDEYDILRTEIDEMSEEPGQEDDGPLELEVVEVSDVEFEIGAGEVYLRSEKYDKEWGDIELDDYGETEENSRALERETPGTSYDSIYILKDGWVQCIKEFQTNDGAVEKKADTYPPEEIKRIRYDVAKKGGISKYDRFDGRFSD